MNERILQSRFEVIDTSTGEVGLGIEPVGLSDLALIRRFKSIHSIISERKIWSEKPTRRKSLYMDLRNNPAWSIKIKVNEWEKDELIKPENVKRLKQLSGVVIVTGSVDFKGGENLDRLKSALVEVEGGLQKHSSVVLVVEDKGEDMDKEPRIEMLKKMGLTKPNILKRVGKKRIIWEARRPKKTGEKVVNVFESPLNKERGYLDKMAERVKKDYLEVGYEVIGTDEINELLTASTFVKRDVDRLREGYGVSLRVSECGCTVDVDPDGEFKNHHACGDSLCKFPLELPGVKEEKQERRYSLSEEINTGMDCLAGGWCGNLLTEKVVLHTQREKKSRVLINISCPNHGLYDYADKWVKNELIDGLPEEG